jgi:precorrin-6x reductase
VPDAEAAARALQATEGPALLTTGSHGLLPFARAVDPARLFARVLPTGEALELCAAAGILSSHIIAMQGPFTRAFNAALYDQWGIRAMVTKDSGQAGGVEEKVIPALERQIHIIMIDRPKEE